MVLLLPLIAGACADPSPQTRVVEIDCERFSATAGDQIKLTRWVTVEEGDSVVVRLCANPSTGFAWEEAAISAPGVLRQQEHDYIPPAISMPGASGMERWDFLAVGKGACTVFLSYSRPWDGGEKGARQFELHVEVK